MPQKFEPPPLKYSKNQPFFLLETNKRVFYPGEYIELAVHLRLTETLHRVDSLSVHLKGVESFRLNVSKKSA